MDVFSNFLFVGECLLDARRTAIFKKAIFKTVKKGDVVLDVGTGSGILAMLSARAGASKVYAVEIMPDVAEFARKNIKANNLENIIEVINIDAKSQMLDLPQKPDVITMELLDTALVAEQQGVVVNLLHKSKIITDTTKLIPERCDSAFVLANYNFSFQGIKLPFVIQARNYGVTRRIRTIFTNREFFSEVDFNKPFSTNINNTKSLEIQKNGVINALVLYSKTYMTPDISIWATSDMNMPVVVPISPIEVEAGDEVAVSIKYKMSEGFSTFRATVVKVTR